jgi:hypothetical protein
MVANPTRQWQSQWTTLNDESAQNDMSRPNSVRNLHPKTGDAGCRSSKKRAKSEKRAASRARGVTTERVVAPESKDVKGFKTPRWGHPWVAKSRVSPRFVGKVMGPGCRDEETEQNKIPKRWRNWGYKWISQHPAAIEKILPCHFWEKGFWLEAGPMPEGKFLSKKQLEKGELNLGNASLLSRNFYCTICKIRLLTGSTPYTGGYNVAK